MDEVKAIASILKWTIHSRYVCMYRTSSFKRLIPECKRALQTGDRLQHTFLKIRICSSVTRKCFDLAIMMIRCVESNRRMANVRRTFFDNDIQCIEC